MDVLDPWPLVVPLLALTIPAILARASAASPRRAELASGTALGLALLVTLGAALTSGTSAGEGPSLPVRVDAVTCVMLLLVGALGLVVVRFSRTYLQGDPGLRRYLRWLLLTLSAVTALVSADNLLVVALAWTAASLALHQLLTYYGDRTPALVAAHKKFLVSRLADGCLVVCLSLVHRSVGSLDLDRIAAWAGSHPESTPAMRIAAVLLVLAVALRSAQLPFHGWLTQVMEAPTPVSALLHAGVVNIGGFVLIRLAPWMAHERLAQTVLVVVGLVSAIVAALVMSTRVSVKVALAWSTCAQMGFMLVQCGLGLWHLALLHLVAHSLYKAHAFLSAGSAVDDWRLRALTKRPPSPTPGRLGAAALVAIGCAALSVAAARHPLVASSLPGEHASPILAVLFGVSLVPLVASQDRARAAAFSTAARVSGVLLLYVAGHAAAAKMVAVPSPSNAPGWALVGFGFAGLFAVKATLHLRPDGRLACALHPWLFAGLYLDERFTRLTFRTWPPRLPRQAETVGSPDVVEALEVRA